MYRADFSAIFARDRKRCRKKHWDMDALAEALRVVVMSDDERIPAAYNDHALNGEMKGYRELHVGGRSSNWVVVYMVDGDTVVFTRTGTHDEVFK
ncbi:MAG: type II toxin-antitoxin system YafQ family toxin [Coriobacteriales bacterium]|jgi:mRNA interferase YafQ|nr:type II toxin-antitoxin system YafQ family toxin [Coriobacteriales bacterium]